MPYLCVHVTNHALSCTLCTSSVLCECMEVLQYRRDCGETQYTRRLSSCVPNSKSVLNYIARSCVHGPIMANNNQKQSRVRVHTFLHNCTFCIIHRLLTLACPMIWRKTTTTKPKEVWFLSSGPLLRQFCTGSTAQRVMCGAMGWWCTRFGHWGTSLLRSLILIRWENFNINNWNKVITCGTCPLIYIMWLHAALAHSFPFPWLRMWQCMWLDDWIDIAW